MWQNNITAALHVEEDSSEAIYCRYKAAHLRRYQLGEELKLTKSSVWALAHTFTGYESTRPTFPAEIKHSESYLQVA